MEVDSGSRSQLREAVSFRTRGNCKRRLNMMLKKFVCLNYLWYSTSYFSKMQEDVITAFPSSKCLKLLLQNGSEIPV